MNTRYAKIIDGNVEFYSAKVNAVDGKRIEVADVELLAQGWKHLLSDRIGKPSRDTHRTITYVDLGDYIVEKEVWVENSAKGE